MFLGFYIAAVFFAFADSQDKSLVEVFNSLGGFISTGGALAAILTVMTMVQHRREDREQNIVKYANYVLFILDRQIRFIGMFGKENLKPYENSPLNVKAYSVLAVTFDPTLVNALKIEESMFLLAVKRPELIALLDQTQRDYNAIAAQIEQRNNLYLSKFQSVMQKNNVKIGDDVSVDEINNLLGEYVVHELMYATEQMYKMLPLIQANLISVQRELYALLMVEFPSHDFFSSVK